MSVKIVHAVNYGGFYLSGEAVCRVAEAKGYKPRRYAAECYELGTVENNALDEDDWTNVELIIERIHMLPRHDEDLVRVVEELGDKASARHTEITVENFDLPSNRYAVREYDGYESIITPESINWTTV